MLTTVRRIVLLCALALSLGALAYAEDAKTLKAQGDAAMDHLDFQVALEKYKAAYDLTKDPALLYNRARALQSLNRMPEALDELERFDREAPPELRAKVPQLPQMLVDFRARVGTLTIKTEVKGARVLVNGIEVGKTPLERLRLNKGAAKVEVITDEFEPYVETVDVPTDGVTLEPKLVRKSTILVVQSSPNAEESTLDGAPGPGTPFEKATTAGKHLIVLKRSGYYDLSTEAVVQPGERKVVTLSMEGKPITARWWFWTAAVFIAAAIAVPIAIAATTERGPDTGDISPGRVSAP